MFHWIKLLDGSLRTQQSKPKNRTHLSETSQEVKGDFQHYVHTFTMYDPNGNERGIYTFHSHCGYDRGPRLQRLVSDLIESTQMVFDHARNLQGVKKVVAIV